MAVCVNVTSWRFDCDERVILMPGDHPFVNKRSIVHYEDARFISLARVEQLIATRTNQFVCEMNYCCTYALMDRLRRGLLESKRTPNVIKEYCRSIW